MFEVNRDQAKCTHRAKASLYAKTMNENKIVGIEVSHKRFGSGVLQFVNKTILPGIRGVKPPNGKGPLRRQSTEWEQCAERGLFCFPALAYGEYSQKILISTK